MTVLDFKSGNVSSRNDAPLTGAVRDVSDLAIGTAENVISIFEGARVGAENTLHLARKPLDTTFTAKNWGRLALTAPAVGADVLMKSMRLPFATLDLALEHVVNNNLERLTGLTKSVSTGLLANVISRKGDSRFKFVRGVGTGVEALGDAAASLIKLPTGMLAKGTSIVDKFLAQGTSTTDGWVKNLQVSENNFIPSNYLMGASINSGSNPEAANSNRKGLVAANDNGAKDAVAA